LQLSRLERRVRDAGLGGQLGGVEESAERDGDLLFKKQKNLAGEAVLADDPLFIR
jgi:hypothetical protein